MSKKPTKNSSTRQNKRQKLSVPLPDVLQQLKEKFERLNLFCAFCDARLTTSMTIQNLQKAVPQLTLEDLAAINVIIPNFVKFHPLTEQTIEIEFGRRANKRFSKQKHAQALGNRGDEWLKYGFAKKGNNKEDIFQATKPDKVKKLIEDQNNLFVKSLENFIKQCEEKNVKIEDYLTAELQKNIPALLRNHDIVTEQNDINVPYENEGTKTMSEVIAGLKQLSFYGGQLESDDNQRTFPAEEPVYGDIHLSEEIKSALTENNINHLYVHQADALNGLYEGKHVIVSTPTASGKSLIYQIPVLEALLKNIESKAMYIFPTKALAQDQMRALQDIIRRISKLSHIMISTFDGDTPSDQRPYIRQNSSIIFTNPDMLHHSILPSMKSWRHFLSKLKYVVVDELHTYNGLFGTHVALIMRRLRRLCHVSGNDNVQFISCSATIATPDELINVDGAPHGKKKFVIWNPALSTPTDELSERRGAVAEGANLLEYLLVNKIRTIAFCKVRKTCELLMKELREKLEQKQRRDILDKVMSYRGGYTPDARRKIESQMFNGQLLGIIATNALELGIDIGSLDAVLMIGVPWTISALWQQSGRSGRRNADSLSLIVCDGNPLDQYYARHPNELFKKEPESLTVNLENSIVIESHIQCAAEEEPVHAMIDQEYFGTSLPAICDEHLTKIGDYLYRPDPKYRPYPSKFVNIRNINEETFAVIDVTENRNIILEEIEVHRVGFEVYEGAIFIHQGRSYLVEECNIDKKYSKVHLTNVDWTTIQRDYTNVDPISTNSTKKVSDTKNVVCLGKVRVSTVVFGYYRIDKRRRIMDTHEVYMDPILVESNGVWADAPAVALDKLDQLGIDPMAAIHAASHCLISLLPKFAYSVIVDLRTECKNPHATRQRPARIALYETQPNGVVGQAFKFFDNLVDISIRQIEECVCESGCPLCIHLSVCSEHNQVCSKEGALIVLRALRGIRELISRKELDRLTAATSYNENSL
ncbi:P-loop containing nucleoside triphosphate hydrolase protein [Mycotypha africana]|uniref:P-loop containing nucleoside triphosphate hydrolase protein n=1 Tax=Mycotypha africana TaxID=64632 RepID=UPI0023013829|nr:P-loop containing nucleoside triphosphate hydrolase protein [Mycotypha africana]KAI8991328.1 P-loop containing nucleoside triphosphate hydrolase protein [Mycotypha africana]